MSSNCKKSYQL